MNATGNEIVVYQPDRTTRVETLFAHESIWLPQMKIAELFGVQKAAISKHLANIYATGELIRAATVSKMETVRTEGGRRISRTLEYYNLDAIIAVGYRVNSARATQFRIWATQVLKAYLLRGYAFNQRLARLEDRMDRRLGTHEERIGTLEGKVDFFVRTSLPPVQGVFFDGQMFDASAFASRHILSARRHILLIDPWVDLATLELLAKKSPGVAVEIVTSPRGNRLSPDDIARFNAQYGGLSVTESPRFHDRFLAIDHRTLYVIGASLKDLGRKCFAFSLLDAALIPALRARIQTP